jgi:glycosyltransferase involved in cell wall biosynthesis
VNADPERVRPVVTLCILCFNQERQVGDALNAALRQTGDPIEIIVSDDGSSDDTLHVARAVAAQYRGLHRVIVRQTPHNLGTLHHLFDVAEIATGDLLVVAAGDDMSLPERVEALVDAWQSERSSAFFSAYRIIDEHGAVIDPHHRFDDRWLPIHAYLPGRDLVSIHGASSAYDRRQLLSLPRPSARILFDDTWLTLILTLLGHRITYIDRPLVSYRRHGKSTTNYDATNRVTKSAIAAADQQGYRNATIYRDAIRSFKEQALALGATEAVAMDVVDRDLRFFDAQAVWPDLPWPAKVAAVTRARQPWMRQWALLRLLNPGLRVAIARARARRKRVA